jgi:hypothetical protein
VKANRMPSAGLRKTTPRTWLPRVMAASCNGPRPGRRRGGCPWHSLGCPTGRVLTCRGRSRRLLAGRIVGHVSMYRNLDRASAGPSYMIIMSGVPRPSEWGWSAKVVTRSCDRRYDADTFSLIRRFRLSSCGRSAVAVDEVVGDALITAIAELLHRHVLRPPNMLKLLDAGAFPSWRRRGMRMEKRPIWRPLPSRGTR